MSGADGGRASHAPGGKSYISPEKLQDAPATKEHTDTLPMAATTTVKFYKMQLELMWQAAEKTTEARMAFERSIEDN